VFKGLIFCYPVSYFTRLGWNFCVLTAYLDEAYNQDAICVGGWISFDENWNALQGAWQARVEQESRDAQSDGLKPLQRYHASDCATFGGDFQGWTRERQIAFVKDLLNVVAAYRPFGFALGASLDDISGLLPNLQNDQEERKKATYTILMQSCLDLLGKTILRELPHERVTVIHDSSGLCGPARDAFNWLTKDEAGPEGAVFASFAPRRWQDCVALQVADLMSYEGFKLTASRLLDKETIRKSLQYLIDEELLLAIGHLPKGAFVSLAASLRDADRGIPCITGGDHVDSRLPGGPDGDAEGDHVDSARHEEGTACLRRSAEAPQRSTRRR